MKRFLYLSLLLFLPSIALIHADSLSVGTAAPKPMAIDQEGNPVDFGAIYAKGEQPWFIFIPKPEAQIAPSKPAVLDSFKAIQDRGITIIGVSSDKPDAQKKFREKYELPFTLVSDTDHKVAAAFGVSILMFGWEKRESFLVRNGKVVWEDLDVDADNHTAEVLKAFDALPK